MKMFLRPPQSYYYKKKKPYGRTYGSALVAFVQIHVWMTVNAHLLQSNCAFVVAAKAKLLLDIFPPSHACHTLPSSCQAPCSLKLLLKLHLTWPMPLALFIIVKDKLSLVWF